MEYSYPGAEQEENTLILNFENHTVLHGEFPVAFVRESVVVGDYDNGLPVTLPHFEK